MRISRARIGDRVRRTPTAVMAATLAMTIALPASAAPTMEVVAEGFAGPLGLAVSDDGTIDVGEAFGGVLTTIDSNANRNVLVDQPGNEIVGVAATGQGNVAFVQTLFDGPPPPEGPAPVLDATLAALPPVANLIDEALAAAFGLPDCVAGETYWVEPVPTDVEVGPDGTAYATTKLFGPGAVVTLTP